MESDNVPNGTSKENQPPAVNFILGDEPEIVIETAPDEYKGTGILLKVLHFRFP